MGLGLSALGFGVAHFWVLAYGCTRVNHIDSWLQVHDLAVQVLGFMVSGLWVLEVLGLRVFRASCGFFFVPSRDLGW